MIPKLNNGEKMVDQTIPVYENIWPNISADKFDNIMKGLEPNYDQLQYEKTKVVENASTLSSMNSHSKSSTCTRPDRKSHIIL